MMPGGRPTKYSKALLKKVCDYLQNYESHGHLIPSIVGLSRFLDLNRDTIHAWKNDPEKRQFSDMLHKIMQEQQIVLFNKGLSGEFNSNIAKLALTKHGYSDKQETKIHADVEAIQLTPEERTLRLRELEIERIETEQI